MALKKTALHAEHRALGARMVDFAGWEMPVSYRGILEEVRAVRTAAGLFDVSHMGSVLVSGADAVPALQRILTNDIAGMPLLSARYSMMCNEAGGVLDDLIVYRLEERRFLLVVNASRREHDTDWLLRHVSSETVLADETELRGILALQGPGAREILQPLADADPGEILRFHAARMAVAGKKALVARTGYTGEDGFEIMCSAVDAPEIWRAILAQGSPKGLLPCGLGARDVLRIEAGLPLYGHELTPEINPYEAGFGWVVKLDKGDFIGREALRAIREKGPKRKLCGFEPQARSIPRERQPIFQGDDQVGFVTSGTYSPTLERPIAMGYLKAGVQGPVEIEMRSGIRVPAEVVSLPFVRGSLA